MSTSALRPSALLRCQPSAATRRVSAVAFTAAPLRPSSHAARRVIVPQAAPLPRTAAWKTTTRPRHSLASAAQAQSRVMASAAADDLLAVLVYVHVKEDSVEAFKEASFANASNSVQEPGVARFDYIQQQDDPTKFVLVEVYKTAEAPAEHKATAHYKKWAETVADMMAEPRSNTKYGNICPVSASGWDVPAVLSSGSPESELGSAKSLLSVHVFVHVKEDCVEAFKEASAANAANSIKEAGIARFDCIQQKDDPTKFVLVEVYCTDDGPAAHKDTAHYATWRDTVADMMAEPRSNIKYINCFPATEAGWKSA